MTKPGRKSAASLAVVTPIPGQRATPPRDLTPAEAAIWRAVAATKPADWFTPDSFPLLKAYCRHSATADSISALITSLPSPAVDPSVFGTLDNLLKMRDRETKAVNTFGRAMRLTQQARLKAEVAATAHGKVNGAGGGARKPWEFG